MDRLLGIGDVEPAELRELVALAAKVKADPGSVAGALTGRSIGLFFMKQSVRTWVSCDVAAIELGVHPVVIRNEQVGLGTGKRPKTSAGSSSDISTFSGCGSSTIPTSRRSPKSVSVPVVNLLSDRRASLSGHRRRPDPRRASPNRRSVLAYIGDGNNTCNSLMLAAAMAGA